METKTRVSNLRITTKGEIIYAVSGDVKKKLGTNWRNIVTTSAKDIDLFICLDRKMKTKFYKLDENTTSVMSMAQYELADRMGWLEALCDLKYLKLKINILIRKLKNTYYNQ